MRSAPWLICSIAFVWGFSSMSVQAQQIGFIEKFALAEDRAKVLQELIPGSEEHYYYYCLHYQNLGQLAEADSMLKQWATKLPTNENWQRLQTRQHLLQYTTDPKGTLEYLRNELGVQLDHAPPQADRAKDLPVQLDPSLVDVTKLLDQSIASDPSLGGISDRGLLAILNRGLNMDQTRALLTRWKRVDVPEILPWIEKELKANDSRGWGAFQIHSQLTLSQRDQFAKSNPKLLENDNFVRQYLRRLLPSDDVSGTDRAARRNYLQALEDFTASLPASQNSLKGAVLFHRLQFDLQDELFDRARFEKYLSLPRQQPYYSPDFLKAQVRVPLIELQANYSQETGLPPIGNDEPLIRRYLEQFFQTDDSIDRFGKWLVRDYLNPVFVETKILYGIGNSAPWYNQLTPTEQKTLRDRVELRFAAKSTAYFRPSDPVALTVDVKNVSKLIVRIYQINPRNVYRKQSRPVSTDIDLDGLVANSEQSFEYSIPADRRHRESIPLPQCDGRGIWVIDLLGGGLRSRALVVKGQLRSTQLLTDAGHELRVYDESGEPAPGAQVEMGTRTFTPDEKGAIYIPYGEHDATVPIMLVDGASASVETLLHRRESYQLDIGVLLDSQNLISGAKGALVIRTQLLSHNRQMPLETLEDVQLRIVTTDQDGIQSSQSINDLKLSDLQDATHPFLVPQRLVSVEVTLSGKVLVASRSVRESVSASKTIEVNGLAKSSQIADFFLIRDADTYRLQVRGRNGEGIGRLPISLSLYAGVLNQPVTSTVATNAAGEVKLGKLESILSVVASADRIGQRGFSLHQDFSEWPTKVHLNLGESVRLPWVHSESEAKSVSLLETKQQQVFADRSAKMRIEGGSLMVGPLDAGTYYLTDHIDGNTVEIRVIKGAARDGFIVGDSQLAQRLEGTPASVGTTRLEDGKVRIQITGGDEATRVHFIAAPFVVDQATRERLRVAKNGVDRSGYMPVPSLYVDSLRLDEEYQYILQRQYATQFPGNLLAQPSLLLNPWDTASTTNAPQDAAKPGEMPPPAASMAPKSSARDPGGVRPAKDRPPVLSSVYEFLGTGAVILANRRPDANGWIEFSLEDLKGFHDLVAVVVHPTGLSTKTIGLPASEIRKTDLRLSKSFALDSHLAQRQSMRILEAGEKIDLGDARSTRVQFYSSLPDVFRFYETLMKGADLAKFRRWTLWGKLSDAEKEAAYNELACHEMHLFLYVKDRPFFDRVVRPYLADKMAPQLVDAWLLNKSLDPYRDLWQRGRLNLLERILVAEKIPEWKNGTIKWIDDAVEANPISPDAKSQRFLAAMAISQLELGQVQQLSALYDLAVAEPENAPGAPADKQTEFFGLQLRREQFGKNMELDEKRKESNETLSRGSSAGGFGGRASRRAGRLAEAGKEMLFRNLDQTREWAESQFHRVPIAQQRMGLVPPGPFWRELAKKPSLDGFLSMEFHTPTTTLSEALLALAVLDLPFEAKGNTVSVESGRLMVVSGSRSVAFIESIENAEAPDPKNAESDAKPSNDANLLVGQELYLASPSGNADPQVPVTGQACIKGVPYRADVVVTNPSSVARTVSVLTQIPQGSLPLDGGKVVQNRSLRLEPYSTQQVQYTFYYPESGEFDHYGAQATVADIHVASALGTKRKVLDSPDNIDKSTWKYVAEWGTDEQVLEFIRTKNVQKIDLSWIAFRMQNRPFYDKLTSELESLGMFEPTLWAYSIRHQDAKRIGEYLSHREDLVRRLGPVLRSPLIQYNSADRYDYEHLDYRPLVIARSHLLGSQRMMYNERLHQQYHRLLERIAHETEVTDSSRLAMTYYFLLQNRIEEAIAVFERIQAGPLTDRIQYDYLDAYLDFHRGRYDHAAELAQKYGLYPVPRWRDLFAQVAFQVKQRQAMLAGTAPPTSVGSSTNVTDPIQSLLVDARQSQQSTLAAESPAIDLKLVDGRIVIQHQKIQKLQVRYYLMDIELLFSRNPFVQQEGGALMAIQPNQSETLELRDEKGKRELVLPKELENRNVMVEVQSGALVKSQVLYANSMDVTIIDAFGRLQATTPDGRPVEKAYVKVYAKQQDGQVRFYKDGYTDLRGQFDYASLSTDELGSVQKFGILVLHPEKGALIREAQSPQPR